jgi:MoaA/NifB/PqqE/SkfB family radical SAM enzyme
MKDYVKISNAIDMKNYRKSVENLKTLQEKSLYPKRLSFPITLQFEMTRNCNLRCKHCYNASGIKSFSDSMQAENWIELSKYIVSKGGIFECILSGGEPLLMGDSLYEIMDILHEDGTSFLLITNGMLLTEETVRRLKKYRFMWLQVSIDGCDAKTHDEFRGVKGSWDKATEGAYFVSKHGIPLTVAHSVTPKSLKDIDKMCELAYQLGAGTILLGEITPSGRTIENKDILLNYEERNELLKTIEEQRIKYSGRMVVERAANTKIQLMRYQNTLNTGAIIRPNGDIRLDCMTPFKIGNVLTDDLYDVWNKKADTCWKNERLTQYIESMDLYTGYSDIINYVDEDILID